MDFYQEFRKLIFSKPRNATLSRNAENSSFGDFIYNSKNIYVSYFISESSDCYYCEYLSKCSDCIDCAYVMSSEICYECVDCSNVYNGIFLQDCHNCSNCSFGLNLLNCKDCFGCFGLRQQRFCIFNKPYLEDAYYSKIAELRKNTPSKILEALAPEFEKSPRLYARLLKGGERSFGDYIYFSKNCYLCFNVRNVTDSAYVSEILNPELKSGNSMDCNYCNGLEACYECFNSTNCTNCNFIASCTNCVDSEYLLDCSNCQNCFGCACLANKEYFILNRRFRREEYLVAVSQIKSDLKAAKTYGKALADVLK